MFDTIEKRKKLNLAFLIVIFILIIILFYTINLSTSQHPAVLKTNINNLDLILPKISEEDKQLLIYQLYDEISKNTPLSTPITTENIMADPSSLQQKEESSYSTTSFVINIESLNQQYQVQYYEGESYEDYKINISCINSCLTTTYFYDQLSDTLPISGITEQTHWILDQGNYFSPKNPSLDLYIDACNQEQNSEKIESSIKDYLKRFSIDNYDLSKHFSCYQQD